MASIYISNSGDDGQDGSTPATAIATLTRLAQLTLVAGDTVYFERGSKFVPDFADPTKSSYVFTSSGTSGSPITFTAYGTGDDPEFNDYVDFSGWAVAANETTDAGGPVYLAWNGSPASVNFTFIQVQPGKPEGVRFASRSVSSAENSSTLDDLNTVAFGVGKDHASNRVYIRTDYNPLEGWPLQCVKGSTSQAPFFTFDLTNQSYIVIENLKFVGVANRKISYPAICIRGTDGVIIRNNTFLRCRMAVSNIYGATDYGTLAYPAVNALIENNSIIDYTEGGIYLFNHSTDCIIQNNTLSYGFQSDYGTGDLVDIGFQGNSAPELHVERCIVRHNLIEYSTTQHAAESGFSGDASVSLFRADNNQVLYNTFRGNNKRVAYTSSGSLSNVFSYNLIEGCVTPIDRHLVNAAATKLIFTNNVISQCSFAPGGSLPRQALVHVESADGQTRIINNFFLDNTLGAGKYTYIDERTGATPRAIINYNYYHNSVAHKWYRDSTAYNTLAEWKTNQVSPDANSIEAAATYAAGTYVPSQGSGLLGVGLFNPSNEGLTPTEDFYGNPVLDPPAIGISELIVSAPVLSEPTVSGETPDGATIGATTDAANGRLYAAARTAAQGGAYTDGDQAAIRDGTVGVDCEWKGDVVPIVGANTFNVTGLDSNTEYFYGFAQDASAV